VVTADLVVPDLDVLGQPTSPYTWTRSEWAVLIDAAVRDVPGPHLLGCQDEQSARSRFDWWHQHWPETNPRLLRRKIVESFGEWQEGS
jgi:hypothetical protein